MACFTIPAAEAIITTIVTKVIESKQKKLAVTSGEESEKKVSVPAPRIAGKLRWLNNLLWGGSALLMFEHIWHGEVVPWFPFLTNAANPEDAAEMLNEMATVGVGMAVLVTAVWSVMAIVSSAAEKRAAAKENDTGEVTAQ